MPKPFKKSKERLRKTHLDLQKGPKKRENKFMPDKFKATWVSHSSISDFLKCPRLYFLRNVYKDKKTGHKITIMTPPLALGQALHEVIEDLSLLPVEERFNKSLAKKFEKTWVKVSGKKGGFISKEQENRFKDRGFEMLKKIEDKPGPLLNKAVKIKSEDGLPFYWLSEEENIILCGKIDWLEYLKKEDAVHIIDFKTGKNEEGGDSLQLPIYHLLAANTQKRKVKKVSYWYLDKDDAPREMELPELKESFEKVYEVARRIKLGRQINHLKCKSGGCIYCTPLERIVRGEGERVTVSDYGQDIYILE